MNTTLNHSIAIEMFPIPPKDEDLKCPYCEKHPHELSEYVDEAKYLNMTAADYVRSEEGTYCQYTGCFVCTNCYVNIGMPSNEQLHTVFPYYREKNPLPGQDNSMIVKYHLGEV